MAVRATKAKPYTAKNAKKLREGREERRAGLQRRGAGDKLVRRDYLKMRLGRGFYGLAAKERYAIETDQADGGWNSGD
jgi:hypothetical protein